MSRLMHRSQMFLFDAHIHLTDDEYSGYLDHIMTSLKSMKIKVCSVTVDIKTSLRSVNLFNRSHRDIITQFIGIHPLAANREDVSKFYEIVNKNIDFIDGIGEIGLDRTYSLNNFSPYDNQIQVFKLMLEIAEKYKKPVSIHSRSSVDDILEIVSTYNIGNVLLHWFSGNKKQLRKCLDMGFYVSYGPALVYLDDKKALLKNTDTQKILVETDGPNRYSRCFKNLPSLSTSFLATVVKSVSETLGMTYQRTVEILERNSERYINKEL